MAAIKQYDRRTEAARKKDKIYYSDFFKNLNVHPEKRDLARHVNEYAVSEALKNLLLTTRGERFFNNNYGSDLRSVLFENASPFLMSALNTIIRTAIRNYEPRVEVQTINVEAKPDQNTLEVEIVYSLATVSYPITLTLILDRVR